MLDGYTFILLFFVYVKLELKTRIYFSRILLKMHPHIGHYLSSTNEGLRLVLQFDFLLHFLFPVLEARWFEFFLIITNWLRIHYRLVGPRSKEDFLSNHFHFPAFSKRVQNVTKTVLIHSQQSQPHIFVTIGSLALLY